MGPSASPTDTRKTHPKGSPRVAGSTGGRPRPNHADVRLRCKAPSSSFEHDRRSCLEWRKRSGDPNDSAVEALLQMHVGAKASDSMGTMAERGGVRRGDAGSKFCFWPTIGRVRAR
jgi:hypothetical protein